MLHETSSHVELICEVICISSPRLSRDLMADGARRGAALLTSMKENAGIVLVEDRSPEDRRYRRLGNPAVLLE